MTDNGPQTYSVRNLKRKYTMKEELREKMLVVIGSPERTYSKIVADKCAQIAVDYYKERERALSMSGVSDLVPKTNREKDLEESLSHLLGMASTWGREWFNRETWEKMEKAKDVLAGTNR